MDGGAPTVGDLSPVIAARDEWMRVLAQGDDAAVRAEAESRLTTCRAALEIVDARLQAIGYPVHPIVRPLDAERLTRLDRAFSEAQLAVPPILTLVWRVVGALSVIDFDRYRHVSFWAQRLGPTDAYTDGLHIDAPGDMDDDDESFVDHLLDEREAWLEWGQAAEGEPFETPVAPDDLHKDNVSGGDPYALVLGATGSDHRLTHFSWTGSPVSAPEGAPDLLSYLRTAILECGCFPGLLGVAAFEPDRERLTADLPVF